MVEQDALLALREYLGQHDPALGDFSTALSRHAHHPRVRKQLSNPAHSQEVLSFLWDSGFRKFSKPLSGVYALVFVQADEEIPKEVLRISAISHELRYDKPYSVPPLHQDVIGDTFRLERFPYLPVGKDVTVLDCITLAAAAAKDGLLLFDPRPNNIALLPHKSGVKVPFNTDAGNLVPLDHIRTSLPESFSETYDSVFRSCMKGFLWRARGIEPAAPFVKELWQLLTDSRNAHVADEAPQDTIRRHTAFLEKGSEKYLDWLRKTWPTDLPWAETYQAFLDERGLKKGPSDRVYPTHEIEEMIGGAGEGDKTAQQIKELLLTRGYDRSELARALTEALVAKKEDRADSILGYLRDHPGPAPKTANIAISGETLSWVEELLTRQDSGPAKGK